MEVKTLFSESFFAQNWQFLAVPLVLAVLINYLGKRRTTDALRHNSAGEKITATSRFAANDNGTRVNTDDNNGDNEDDDEEGPDQYRPSLEEKEHVPFSGATITIPGGVKQFHAMVNNRRSVRSFSNRHVPLEVIEDCIRSAGTAPSGAHTEPWTFCVISDPDMKQNIRAIVEAEEELNYAHRMHRQWTTDLRPLRTDHVKPYMTTAPYLILVFKQIYGQNADGSRRQHYYNEISVSIATGVLLCALQSAGLSSLVTTPLNCGPALRLLLDRPENEKLLVLLPVGYPADDCVVPDLKRKDLKDIMVAY